MLWLLISLFLFTPNPVLAQDSPITPTPEIQTTDVSPSPTEAPTVTPSPTTIPTPTIDPVLALFQQYQQDYFFQRDNYQKAYTDYNQKKQVYTKYKTLTTEKDKLEATRSVLLSRNNALKTYLLALRVNLDRYKTIDPTNTEKNQIELSKWESWFEEQNTVVNSLNNDADFKNWGQTFKEKYVGVQQAIYTSLIQSESNYRQSILKDIQSLSADIQSSPQISSDSQSWFANFPVKTDLVLNSLAAAQETTKIRQNTNKFRNFYPDAKRELNKANNYLLELHSNLISIVTKFRQ
jgi:hypothetical protein